MKESIKKSIDFKEMSPAGQLEYSLLDGISKFLSKVKDLDAQDAYLFVRCSEYVKLKLQEVAKKEVFLMEAKRADELRKSEAEAKKVAEKMLENVPPAPEKTEKEETKEDSVPPTEKI